MPVGADGLDIHEDSTYEVPLANPESVYNWMTIIRAHLDNRPELDLKTHFKIDFSYDATPPGHRYLKIMEHELGTLGYPWRFHSLHVNLPEKVVKLILRKHSLLDLVDDDDTVLQPHELRLYEVMRLFAETTGKDGIPDPNNLEYPWDNYLLMEPGSMRIFRSPDGHYTYLYRVIFTIWEYDERNPTEGWRCLEDNPLEIPDSL